MTKPGTIKKIEKELDVELTEVDEIEFNAKGYTVNQHGHVNGLGLFYSNIVDLKGTISLLKDPSQLQALYLTVNSISDISALKDLPQLESLGLANNPVSDYSVLKALTRLRSLNLGTNPVGDYSFLKDLPQLRSLKLY
ncbi:MAG: leucine-rich repeat domain-containing protein, partial [Planctomycetota bacterium]